LSWETYVKHDITKTSKDAQMLKEKYGTVILRFEALWSSRLALLSEFSAKNDKTESLLKGHKENLN
jgi:hypothetical protein